MVETKLNRQHLTNLVDTIYGTVGAIQAVLPSKDFLTIMDEMNDAEIMEIHKALHSLQSECFIRTENTKPTIADRLPTDVIAFITKDRR